MIRQSALRASVQTVLSAPMEREGDTNGLKVGSSIVNRVNIIGTVVSFQPDENVLSLDDGTGTILVQWFDGSKQVAIGDLILVIGRVRDFEGRYVLPEILRPLEGKWLAVRRAELANEPVAQAIPEVKAAVSGDDPEESALKLIHTLDHGDGADMDEVVEKLGSDGEEVIKRLLMAGEIFESKPGRLRLL